MEIAIVLGNIFGFGCGLFCTLSTFGKSKKQITFLQSLDCLCGVISCLILQGYSGALVQSINLIRNLLILKMGILNKFTSYFLILLTVIVGLTTNNQGISGLLPIIATLEYTLIILKTENVNYVKIGLIANNVLWIVYDLFIHNYVGFIYDAAIIGSSIYNLLSSSN